MKREGFIVSLPGTNFWKYNVVTHMCQSLQWSYLEASTVVFLFYYFVFTAWNSLELPLLQKCSNYMKDL